MKLKKYTASENISKWLIILPFLILFLFGCFFPIIWSIFKIKSLNQIGEILSDKGLFLSLKISVFTSMVSTLIVYFYSYILANALLFSKYKIYKYLITASLFIPMVIPAYSLIIIYRSIIEGIGGQSILYKVFSINTDIISNSSVAIISVIFILSFTLIPFTTFLIYTSFKNVKKGILEMGKIDGLGAGGELWHVLIPITFPVISSYAIFNFLKYLKNFQIPFLMTSGLPPMRQGVFPKSIVGATTNLGVFLFDKLNNVYNVSTIAAYSFGISIIVILFSLLWYLGKINKVKRVYTIFLLVFFLHLLDKNNFPLIFYLVSMVLFYKHSRKFKNFYFFGVLTDLFVYIYASFSFGVYNNYIISSFLSGFLIIYVGIPETNSKMIEIWNYLKIVFSILWVILSFLPLIGLIQLSFSYLNFPPFILPFHFSGFNNFIKLFGQENFSKNILNTFIIAIFASVINITLTFPMAVAAKTMDKTRSFIYSVAIFFGIFTGIHTIIPIYKFFANFSIFNTLIPVIIMSCIHSMPIVFMILIGFLNKYNKSYDEMAIMEGGNFFYRLTKIYLPLSGGAIFLSFIYTFIQSYNSFILPLFLVNNDNLYPVSIKLYNYAGSITSTYPQWNLFGAGTLTNLIVVIIVFYFIQKNSSYKTYENFY